jgi:glycosyltransferase involved in cell wall biosynthesis
VNDAGFFVSHRLAVAIGARDAGYEVHVASPPGPDAERILAAGIAWHAMPLTRSGGSPWRELQSLISIYRLYRRVKPSIAHLVTIKPVLYGGLMARLARVPAVVAAVSGLGFIFMAPGFRAAIRRNLIARIYRAALGHPHLRVIFQNPDDRNLITRIARLDEKETVLIRGSGVTLGLHTPSDRSHRWPLVVMASRLLRDKGVREFVQAAGLLRARGVAVDCWLVGDRDPGNPTSVSEEEIHAWRAEGAVRLPGFTRDIPALFARAQIVVLPSYREGLPKVLLEAAASGCAVVTTDVPGCRDAIAAGETGLLVPPRDATALAGAIQRLVENPELCRRFGRAGRALAEEHFSIEMVVASHLAVYQELSQ